MNAFANIVFSKLPAIYDPIDKIFKGNAKLILNICDLQAESVGLLFVFECL